MADFKDIKIFDEKSLSDLFQQIHGNSEEINQKIEDLVSTLTTLIKDAGSAVMLMPTVKDLIDVNVKNNDQLVKMAAIVQRASSNVDKSSNDTFFDENELQQLIEEHKKVQLNLIEEEKNTIKLLNNKELITNK